ncbi:MAG: MFS transporter [Verrucomicrobia bacterium]|nr:MFS transporter [Verrucomicrobiota bacterium]
MRLHLHPGLRMRLIPTRAWLVFGTFLLSLLLYVDRTCISTAKDEIVSELALSDKQWAWVLASFAFGYALFQTPSGALADRLGGRAVLTTVVTLWSVFTGLTAAAWNFVSLLVVRFIFGAGEAGAFPGMAKVVYSWIPVRERGLVKGINFSGSRVGAAVAMPLIAALIAAIGWKLTFIVLMVVGFGWAGFWWWWFRDDPRQHRTLPKKELDYILVERQEGQEGRLASRPDAAAGKPLLPQPLRVMALLRSGNLWLMMTQYFGSNFTFFFALSWLYPYVKKKYTLDAVDAGFYAMMPLLAGALGNVISGGLVDRLYRAGWLTWSRRAPAIIGFALAALGMVMSVQQATPLGAVAWLSVAIFGADMTLSPSWSFCIDIGGPHAGAVSGTMNMAGNLGSAITALAFAYLPESARGNVAFFYTAAALSGLAIVCWLLARPERKIQSVES